MDFVKISARLSPLGIALLVIGALLGYLGNHIGKTEKQGMLIRLLGLLLVIVAAAQLLEVV